LNEPTEFLDLDDLLILAERLLGSPVPVKDVGLLGSAAARPQTAVFGEDAYGDVWAKAAALLHSIVKNHPLVDGNKRLGWLATAVFLELNGVNATVAGNDEVYELVVAIAAGHHEVDEIAAMLRAAIEAD
jgi:death-on-curing protein